MKFRAVSGIMLALLFLGMFAIAIDIQAYMQGSIDPARSIAIISLVIGPIFAVLGLRNMVEQKQTHLVTRLEELKEKLGRGGIPQEEYEHLLFTLSNLPTAIITEEEYEQKKKNLLEKSET
jgi:uncharacterized membrane protein